MPNEQGILYNRFYPGFTLLPYSDQSKIITYATYDNFDPDSTTWGDGICPIRSSGTWYKDHDAQGFISFASAYNSLSNTSAIGNAFTVYEVLKHVNYPETIVDTSYNLVINRGSSNEYLLSPYNTGAQCAYSNQTSIGNFDVGSIPTLDTMHITASAFEYLSDGPKSSISEYLNYGASRLLDRTTTYGAVDGIQIAGTSMTTRCYKFIAIVQGDESQIYIGSRSIVEYNMAVLKSYFGVDYPSPI